MNANYIARALCYHGQPLQKLWDDERGVEDLRRLNLTQPNYSVYQERQKFFTFQERAKRLKIHQFLARKACDLFDKQLVGNVMEDSWLAQIGDCVAPQPPIEFFMNAKDKRKAWAHRMSALKQGDIICATVQKIMSNANRIVVKPLCTAEPLHFYLADIPIKAIIFQDQWGPLPLDKQGNPRPFAVSDFIRCEVCSVSADVERLTLGMLGVYCKTSDVKLGLCDLKDFPKYYRQIHNQEHPSTLSYEEHLNAALEFENPNYDVLFQLNGLQPNENLTLINKLRFGFPEADYAPELRQKQASQWAFRSVADGIEHFKNGQQVEAFQCLNKALNIDPRNVEGLVARGALYANRGSFLKGLKDFEKALILNKYHVNARKYMGETLVALGRSYEEENRIPDAIKAYTDCLNLLPQHEQALISLDALKQRPTTAAVAGSAPQSSMQSTSDMLNLPTHSITIGSSDDSSSSSGSDNENDSEEQPGKLKASNNQQQQQPYLSIEQDKRAVSDSQTANEFKLEDDETMSSVRKLLREASKHKKSKKKGKKKKDKDKEKESKKGSSNSKKYKSKSSDDDGSSITTTEVALEMLKKIDYAEAYRIMSTSTSEAQVKTQLQNYFKANKTQSETSTSPVSRTTQRNALPSGYKDLMMEPSTSKHAAAAVASIDEQPPPAPKFHQQHYQQQKQEQQSQQRMQKLSFQIKKRPLQMDKFGLLRLATPLSSHSHSRSRSRSPKRSHNSRSHSRSRGRRTSRRHSRSSRSRSSSRSRHSRPRRRRTRSRTPHSGRSRSRSITPHRYGGGGGGGQAASAGGGTRYRGRGWFKARFGQEPHGRRSRSFSRGRRSPSPFVPRRSPSPFVARRTPSPFVPRRTPSPGARYRRTRSRSISPRRFHSPRYTPRGRGRGYPRGRFQHRWTNFDNRNSNNYNNYNNGNNKMFNNNNRRYSPEHDLRAPGDDEPSVEEVDEMIKEAQKERKIGIIESDKDILKKKATNSAATSTSDSGA